MDRPSEKKGKIKITFKQHLLTPAVNNFQRAAKGDEDVMNQLQPQQQQQQQGMAGVDELKGKWKQHVGSSKIAWSS